MYYQRERARPDQTDPARRNVLRYAGAALFAGALGPVIAVRASPVRSPSFSTLDMIWADVRRQRGVPVRLYLPENAHPVPLVVFSHGIGGSRRGYSWLGQHFASNGIACLHMQHVGSDSQLWSGNVFNVVHRLRQAAREDEAVARAHDVSFVLDTLLEGALGARIDAGRIVAAGHSYGANTTLLASGAQVQRNGRPLDLRDARIRAAIVISAPPFYGEPEPRKILQTVTVPSLHITCTDDVIHIPGYYSAAEDRVATFDATGSSRKWLTVYRGGSHSMFTDRGTPGGVVLNARVKAATQALSLAFISAALGGDARELAAWPRRHENILERFSVGAV
ncbi:MAG: acetylhydrolase [Pseudomonadota bacterium]